jgi:hypothetical protein
VIVKQIYTVEQVRQLLLAAVTNERGGKSTLARTIGVPRQFLNDILYGRQNPSGKVLDWLGLKREVVYTREVL